MNILERIKLGTQGHKDIQWPMIDGSEVTVRLTVLSEDSILMASHAADKMFADYKVEAQNWADYDVEKEIQQLFRSIKDPDTDLGLTKSITEFRKLLTPTTRDFLASELEILNEKYSPNIEEMNDEDFDKLFEDLKKKPKEILGSVSNLSIAKRLLLALVNPPKI